MSVVSNPTEPPVDPNELLQAEIQACEDQRRPISRQALAELVAKKCKMPMADAVALVDAYCEVNAPAIPYYLSSEFNIGWQKVLAFFFAAIGMAVIFQARQLHRPNVFPWWWYCLGVVIIGIGVLFWVKSLESAAARRRSSDAEN